MFYFTKNRGVMCFIMEILVCIWGGKINLSFKWIVWTIPTESQNM